MSGNRKLGAAIAIGCALIAVGGLITGYVGQPIAAGVAVVGIAIGTGVARGNFSKSQDATKKN